MGVQLTDGHGITDVALEGMHIGEALACFLELLWISARDDHGVAQARAYLT